MKNILFSGLIIMSLIATDVQQKIGQVMKRSFRN
jgi:hypothetical protein